MSLFTALLLDTVPKIVPKDVSDVQFVPVADNTSMVMLPVVESNFCTLCCVLEDTTPFKVIRVTRGQPVFSSRCLICKN